MSSLHTLANGESFIYIASRVFDIAEKLKAECMERAVLKGISQAMRDFGIIPRHYAPITFVPFRDTVQKKAEQKLVSQEHSLTQNIYVEDIDRLRKLFAFVGFFDGLSKDEGICMELGYAFGIDKPIVLAITDFVRTDFKSAPNTEHLVDPVIGAMASKIVYEYRIPNTGGTFREQLQLALDTLLVRVETEVYSLGIGLHNNDRGTRTQSFLQKSAGDTYDVYVDFGGGLFEWQRRLQEELIGRLSSMGLFCAASNRYYPIKSGTCLDIEELGQQDISSAACSTVIVTCSDSVEMMSGTAAIQGFCRAIDKKILLYDSKATNIVADNQYKSSRNLMIDYSADMIAHQFDDIPLFVEKLLS